MRMDTMDLFETPLEYHFIRRQIVADMIYAGLEVIRFSGLEPYWLSCSMKIR